MNKIIKLLFVTSLYCSSFNTFSAWIPIGISKNVELMLDTNSIAPIHIEGYENYKEVKLKGNVIKTDHFGSIGEYVTSTIWINCKDTTMIQKSVLIFNKNGSLKEQENTRQNPTSFDTASDNHPFKTLCKDSSTLTPTKKAITKETLEYKQTNANLETKTPQMSEREYQKTIQDMDKKIAAALSHRSRLHSGRDPENPDIITKVTKENILANTKKDLELTCKRLKLLREKEQFIRDQNFTIGQIQLVSVYQSMQSDRQRVHKKIDSIKAQGGKADMCSTM